MIDKKRLMILQNKIAEQVIVKDCFERIELVTGFDLVFVNKKAICAAVTLDYNTMQHVENAYIVDDEAMPYIPTFLAFREGPPILKLYDKLRNKPDVIMVDGHGILHPSKAGLATFVGVTLDKPSIGVAKTFLCGDIREDIVCMSNEPRGYRLVTKKAAKPIFVSPGHKISLRSSVKIVKHLIKDHKLPEPLRLAHKYANKLKEYALSGNDAKDVSAS